MNQSNGSLAYVLITPARDEEATIEKCIQAVEAQTVLPRRWIVVSDGSTDRTDQIVKGYCRRHDWLRLIRVEGSRDRHFGAKVRAFNAGRDALDDLPYQVIGNLDADITFGKDYFEFLMGRFLEDPLLGVAGTPFVENGAQYDYSFTSIEHVSGACQLFRRECFEQIGGYVPIAGGGIDWTAVTTARMEGWRTRTFPERVCYHHRKIGTGGGGSLSSWFRHGKKDFFLGGHPLWQLFRGCYQMTRRPFLLAGLLLISGYFWGWISGTARPISKELMAFHRKEQMRRLRDFLFKKNARDAAVGTAKDRILGSLKQVEQWVAGHDFKGYEPFDGLSSFLRPLTFGNLLLDRVLLQLVRQSPVNLRPLLGIKPLDSTIGRGYMAWGYLCLLKSTGSEEYGRKARACLEWLAQNRSPGFTEYCWGKHFDFAGRGGRYPKFEPIAVWTSLIGMAFLEGFEVLGESRYLEVAESLCRWLLGLARSETEEGACLSYTASGQPSSIHNHGLLAAGVLARTARHVPNEDFRRLAEGLVRYSCSRQLPDGAWYYGEEPMYHWIDNFHTGYNLDGLRCYEESTGDTRFSGHLERGLDFYMSHFFESSGRPRYYHDRTFPVDSQCISQAIDTLANFSELRPAALPLALRVAEWAIGHMQDRRGYFYYRQYPLLKARTPMLHWAQATTFKALAMLSARL